MIWIKRLYKSGGSRHVTIPKDWLNALKSKFGSVVEQVSITEIDDDLLVKAVRPDKVKREKK